LVSKLVLKLFIQKKSFTKRTHFWIKPFSKNILSKERSFTNNLSFKKKA
jgi:hypothetical protein